MAPAANPTASPTASPTSAVPTVSPTVSPTMTYPTDDWGNPILPTDASGSEIFVPEWRRAVCA